MVGAAGGSAITPVCAWRDTESDTDTNKDREVRNRYRNMELIAEMSLLADGVRMLVVSEC